MSKINKKLGKGFGKQAQQNFKANKKPRWGKKGFRSPIPGRGTAQTMGESNFGSVATVRWEETPEGLNRKRVARGTDLYGLWRKVQF